MNLDVCIVYVCILYKKSDAFGDNIDPFDEKLNILKGIYRYACWNRE